MRYRYSSGRIVGYDAIDSVFAGDVAYASGGQGGAALAGTVIAGLVIWAVLALADLSLVVLTNLTVGHVVATHGPNLVSVLVSTVVGAWVYREEATPARAPA